MAFISSSADPHIATRRRLRIAFYCEALFGFDQFSTATALLFFINFRSFSYAEFFLYISVIFATSAILEIPFSILGELFSRKRLFIIGKGVFLAGFVIATFSPNLIVLLTASIITGIGQAIQSRNFMSLMFDNFRNMGELKIHELDTIRARSIALVFNATIIVAGGILGERSLLYPMIADSFLICLSICIALSLLPDVAGHSPSDTLLGASRSMRDKATELAAAVRPHASIIFALVLFGVATSSLSRISFSLYQPILSLDGWNVKQIGYILAGACFVGGCLGYFTPQYLRRKRSFIPYAMGAIVLIAAAGVSFFFSKAAYFWPLLGILLHQIIRSSLLGAAPFYANTLLPDTGAFRVTFNAIFSVIIGISLSLGTALIAPFVDMMGPQHAIVALHAVVLTGLVCIYPIARTIRY